MFPTIKTLYIKLKENKREDLLEYSSVHMTHERKTHVDTESGHKAAF